VSWCVSAGLGNNLDFLAFGELLTGDNLLGDDLAGDDLAGDDLIGDALAGVAVAPFSRIRLMMFGLTPS